MYVKYKLITLVDKTIFKRIRAQTQRYSDINFNSQKQIKLEKEIIPVINCFFSDESTLSSKSDADEDTNIIKASKAILEISLFSDFHLYVKEFKMNKENRYIIEMYSPPLCY